MAGARKCCLCDGEIPSPSDCLELFQQPVCSRCEDRLTRISPDDDRYQHYKDRIKEMWFRAKEFNP